MNIENGGDRYLGNVFIIKLEIGKVLVLMVNYIEYLLDDVVV